MTTVDGGLGSAGIYRIERRAQTWKTSQHSRTAHASQVNMPEPSGKPDHANGPFSASHPAQQGVPNHDLLLRRLMDSSRPAGQMSLDMTVSHAIELCKY